MFRLVNQPVYKVIYYPVDVSISVLNKRQGVRSDNGEGGGGGLVSYPPDPPPGTAIGLGYFLLSLIISALSLIKNLQYASSTGHLLPLFCCPSLAY